MKMIISIVHSDDARPLLSALMEEGFRATVVSTTGGFLREGNTTILIGTERVEEVLAIIKENCCTRTRFINPLPSVLEPQGLYMPHPIEVQIGGATIFVLNVERHERF